MFNKLFKDIPKMVRILTKMIGIILIVEASSAVIFNFWGIGQIMAFVTADGQGTTLMVQLIGFIVVFMSAILKGLLIIIAGEIVARVYSVWEKSNPVELLHEETKSEEIKNEGSKDENNEDLTAEDKQK